MSPSRRLVLLACGTVLALAPAPGAAAPPDIQPVQVTNFPDPQAIEGTVRVDGTVRHAVLQPFRDILVAPVGPRETTRLRSAGTLAADGFTGVVLGLGGQTRGRLLRPATVGAILVPDEEVLLRAFDDLGQAPLALQISTPVGGGDTSYFVSEPATGTIGFPRYQVFFYNTSDRPVSVSLYAYLTN